MKKTLIALAAAAAIVSGSGLARAEAAKPTLAPFGSLTNTQMATAKIEQPQTSTRLALTDDQMDKVSAGHYSYWGKHNGWFYIYSYYGHNWYWVYGYHNCGPYSC
jgi:hypothetical protein